MKREHFLFTLFLLVCAVFFYLFYRLISPFFVPIAWAAVFGILFYPLYEKFQNRIRSKGLAAFLVCAVVIILIIGPITYLFIAVVNEAADAVAKVNALYKAGKLEEMLTLDLPWLASARDQLGQYVDVSKINMDDIARDAMDAVSGVLLNQTTWLATNAARTAFFFGLMIFTTYYFFKEGAYLLRRIKRLMPFAKEVVDTSFNQLRDIIQATMYGGVVVALLQGLLGGVLFAVVGIPSPIFWGAVMAFLSIIPFVGAFIVYIPAGIILLVGGSPFKGLLVIAFGTVVISQIDNVLRPFLIAGKTSLHPLVLFFAILGGIPMFGLLGIVVGPMIAAVFLTLLDVFELKLHANDEIAEPAETG